MLEEYVWYRARVRYFNPSKGYGFLVLEGTRKKVYMSERGKTDIDLRLLRPTDLVEVQVKSGYKGLRASRIRFLEPARAKNTDRSNRLEPISSNSAVGD